MSETQKHSFEKSAENQDTFHINQEQIRKTVAPEAQSRDVPPPVNVEKRDDTTAEEAAPHQETRREYSDKELAEHAQTLFVQHSGYAGDTLGVFESEFSVDELARLVEMNEKVVTRAKEQEKLKTEEKYKKLGKFAQLGVRLGLRQDPRWVAGNPEELSWAALARNRMVAKMMELSTEELKKRFDKSKSDFERHAIKKLIERSS